MGTKKQPGEFDCYAKLGPDEPYFVLRAKDPYAPQLVLIWKLLRSNQFEEADFQLSMAKRAWENQLATGEREILPATHPKAQEASQVATEMTLWFRDNVTNAKT